MHACVCVCIRYLLTTTTPTLPYHLSLQASLVSGPAVRLFVKTGNYDDVLMKVQLAVLRPETSSETVALDLTLGFDDQGIVEFFIEPVVPGTSAPSEVHISGFVNPVPNQLDDDDDDEDDEEDDEDDDEEGMDEGETYFKFFATK